MTMRTSEMLGEPAAYIGITVVTSSSEMMRGFVSVRMSAASGWRGTTGEPVMTRYP